MKKSLESNFNGLDVNIWAGDIVFPCPACEGLICGPTSTVKGALPIMLYVEMPEILLKPKTVHYFEDKRPRCPYCSKKLNISIHSSLTNKNAGIIMITNDSMDEETRKEIITDAGYQI